MRALLIATGLAAVAFVAVGLANDLHPLLAFGVLALVCVVTATLLLFRRGCLPSEPEPERDR